MTPEEKAREKEYKITFEHCKTLIHGVCRQCGGELTPIETIDNSKDPTFWPHCEKCSIYEYGVPVTIYRIAKELVMNKGYRHYIHMDEMDCEKRGVIEYFYNSQIAGACSIVFDFLDILKKMDEQEDEKLNREPNNF